MNLEISPNPAIASQVISLRGTSKPYSPIEVSLDGVVLQTPRYPCEAVDPPSCSRARDQRYDVVQVMTDQSGRFYAHFYIPDNIEPGLHTIAVTDFGIPRATAKVFVEILERMPGSLPLEVEVETNEDDFTQSFNGGGRNRPDPGDGLDAARLQLASSSWPMIYHDARLTATLDINRNYKNDDVSGPHAYKDGGSYFDVGEKWRSRGLGVCVSNVSQGTDGSLYYVVTGPINGIYKIDPTTGRRLRFYSFGASLSPNQPVIVRENGADKIFVGVRGRFYKFNSDLVVLQYLTLSWNNPDDLSAEPSALLPCVCAFSNQAGVLVFVANGATDLKPAPGTVLYAVDPADINRVAKLDIVLDLDSELDLDELPTFINTINTAAIGPFIESSGTTSTSKELVYVLLSNNYLLAYQLNSGSSAASVTWGPRRWPINIDPSYLKRTETPDINTNPPGYYFNAQAGTSPTVSPDGRRVYICSGIYTEEDATGPYELSYVKPRLYAYDTLTGNAYWMTIPDRYYYFEDANDEDPLTEAPDNEFWLLDGKVISSPVAEFDVSRGITMIYFSVKDGAAYGVADTGSQLYMRWYTYLEPDDGDETTRITMYGANAANAGNFYYAPFYYGKTRKQAYAAGFPTLNPDCLPNTPKPQLCIEEGAKPNWKYPLASPDLCVRTLTMTPDGKTQVFFGTETDLYCFHQVKVSPTPARLPNSPFFTRRYL